METTINNLNHNGEGITKINEKITFVKNALPEETVEIEITKIRKKYNQAEVKKYIKTSPKRVEPTCPYYMECGGCDIMHMDYKSQIEYKKEKITNILKKYTNNEIEPIIIESNKNLNYRNKITLHYKNEKLGYMKENTNEIIEIEKCQLAMDKINEAIKKNKNVKEELIIRENTEGKIITNINKEKMIEKINEYKFQVDTDSFFQVNHYICGKIFEIVEENIKENATCLDLYSGVGTLSIVASKKAKYVYSIEINEHSYKNALENLKLNKKSNIKFILGDVQKEIKNITEKIDIIITDPPRKGINENTIKIIEELEPNKIIYISCDPMTLARDINTLKKYKISKLYILDMFPNTHHVECVCVLNKQ
ncbi:MAG: class I SAM-dependent RNA methyltransferase [Bacilli bacterium]|nr:class I SAM-dependent RNA methyltransferase [Bacilli bacterium]